MKREDWLARLSLRSVRARLITAFLALIAIPIGLLGWFMLNALEHFYLSRLEDDMNVEAGLIAATLADSLQAGDVAATQDMLNNPPHLLSQARVFVFDASGKLIASTEADFLGELRELAPESGVAPALVGRSTRGIEDNPSVGIPIAYAARPIYSGNQIVGAIHLNYTLDEIAEAQRQLRIVIVGAVLAAAAAGVVISLRLTDNITNPLARLDAAAAEIASGRFRHRVPEGAPTEIAALARSFNRMAEALQNAEEARQSSFANIAHDVRTPLGSIQAAAEALVAGAADKPELRARLLSGLIEHSQYLRRLTDDLLRLATYEGGGLVLRRSAIALGPLVEQAARGLAAHLQSRSVVVEVDVPPSLPPVWADADRVLEILFNLLDNALRYVSPGGRIRIWAEQDSGQQTVSVHVGDSGPGIPAELLPGLFERHRRGEYGRTTGGANVGLGLSIAREIVLAHGGAIAAANLPDGGADFFFSLPVADGRRAAGRL